MKKILHVISSTDPKWGGPIVGINQLAKSLKKNGWEIDCVNNDMPSLILDKKNQNINLYNQGPSILKYSFSLKLIPWLKANYQNYNLVVINGIWQYTSFATWKVLAGKNIPYIVFTHGMLDPWFKSKYPIKHIKKTLYWWLIERKVLQDARYVVFTCEEEMLLARKSFKPYKINEYVIPYGINSAPTQSKSLRDHFLTKHQNLNGKKLVLFLSRIHEKKGCDLLIEAFSEFAKKDPNLHLVIAGPDNNNLSSKLKTQASKLLISDRITWTGMIEGDEKWGAYYAADVFCLPSHQENFGIVIAEALSCGVPVLITNKVNIWREIESAGAGIIEEDTLEGTKNALEKWLKLSPLEQLKTRQNAIECFNSNFEISLFARSLEMICNTSDDLCLNNLNLDSTEL
jgi:glycosyltransferase involved in cell wall biosynthesis